LIGESLPALKTIEISKRKQENVVFFLFGGEILRIGFINGRKGSASYIIE